jgi:RND family efflux transporter MFP subunit
MTSLWKQLIICAVLIACGALGWQNRDVLMQLSGASAAPQAAAVRDRAEGTPVIVAQTKILSDDRTLTAIGTGFAFRAITLRAPSNGEIAALAIAPGTRFSQGDTLLRLEDRDERFAVSLAEARFDRASDERARYRRLEDSGVAAAARLEEILTAFQVAEIELERAREDLDDRVLRAPFGGITGLATVEIGDRIAIDEVVGTLDDRSSILIEFDIPEALLGRVTTGMGVQATTPSVEGRTFEGEISAIDSRVNAATRTARVRAIIDNTADMLRPGASFAVQLNLPGTSFPAVPELALQFSQGALHVWRVAEGVAERVEVRLVRRSAGMVIVDGPLAQGNLVVVEGTQRLRGGGAVNVLNAPKEPRT